MKDTVSQPAGGRGATAPRPADAASPSCGSSPSADSVSVVLAGGGTAGHVEPAMAVADALVALDPRVRITALGTLRGLETRLVPQRGYHLELITAVPMPRKPGGDLARLPSRVWRAVREARDVLDDVDADVVVGFGGYVALPAYLAARGLPLPPPTWPPAVFACCMPMDPRTCWSCAVGLKVTHRTWRCPIWTGWSWPTPPPIW